MAYDNLTQTIMKFCDNAERKFKIEYSDNENSIKEFIDNPIEDNYIVIRPMTSNISLKIRRVDDGGSNCFYKITGKSGETELVNQDVLAASSFNSIINSFIESLNKTSIGVSFFNIWISCLLLTSAIAVSPVSLSIFKHKYLLFDEA